MDPLISIAFLTIISSSIFFKILDYILFRVGIPECVKSHALCTSSSGKPEKTISFIAWKWRNTLLSLFHSLVSGTWAISCFFVDPKLAEDLITRHSLFSVELIAFSMGYFMHDAYHMSSGSRSRSSYELLIHHAMVLLCFGIAVTNLTYIGYAVVALLVEIHSVFLHLRQVLQGMGFARNETPYRVVSLINIGTVIVFRIIVVVWMHYRLVINQAIIPVRIYWVFWITLTSSTVINIVIFYRVLYSDFLKQPKSETAKLN